MFYNMFLLFYWGSPQKRVQSYNFSPNWQNIFASIFAFFNHFFANQGIMGGLGMMGVPGRPGMMRKPGEWENENDGRTGSVGKTGNDRDGGDEGLEDWEDLRY